jgi:hypothetical protein
MLGGSFMENVLQGFARVIAAVVVLTAGYVQAQEAATEKHVKDIQAEQTHDMVVATALCQQIRASGHGELQEPVVDPATLETDLSALMRKSDEVVLVGPFRNQMSALSPSGAQAVSYYDVRVLRSWKGSHKVGDLLTFVLPFGAVNCKPVRIAPAPTWVFLL